MAFNGTDNNTVSNEQLGVFTGYLRRPSTTQTGMTAQFFGPNGQEADMIATLSLSKFQDLEVYVSVYLIKDANGQLMKENNKYPLISSFLCYIRRPTSSKHNSEAGMTANFYAPNGPGADSMTALCYSDLVDSLVFVDIRGSLAIKNKEVIDEENMEFIDDNYSNVITTHEMKLIKKNEKKFKKMNELILNGEFLTRQNVVSALSPNAETFKDWLIANHGCIAPTERPCMNDSTIVEVDFVFKPHNYLPCCSEHKGLFSDLTHLDQHKRFYELKHRLLLREWAWSIMKERFSLDGVSEPDPARIIAWALSKKLETYLPEKYKAAA